MFVEIDRLRIRELDLLDALRNVVEENEANLKVDYDELPEKYPDFKIQNDCSISKIKTCTKPRNSKINDMTMNDQEPVLKVSETREIVRFTIHKFELIQKSISITIIKSIVTYHHH